MAAETYSTLRLIVGCDICHDIIFALRRGGIRCVVLSRVAEKEAHISDRVISFSRLQTADSVFKTIGSNAVIEAASLHSLSRDTYNLLNATGCVHDSQGSREPVEEQGSSRLMSLIIGAEIKLARQMR
jgi:hypothetical protein